MSHVKISSPGGVGGVTIEIDGHPVKDAARIQVDMPVDDIAQVHLGVHVTQPFEWEGDASVNLHLHVPEGCRLIDIRTHSDPPGVAKWIVTKITPVILFLLLAAPAFAQGVMKFTKAAPSTPDQAAAVFQRSHPPIEFPVVYEGPTVTFTGATAPYLGPWDQFSIRSYRYGVAQGYTSSSRNDRQAYRQGRWRQAWPHIGNYTGTHSRRSSKTVGGAHAFAKTSVRQVPTYRGRLSGSRSTIIPDSSSHQRRPARRPIGELGSYAKGAALGASRVSAGGPADRRQ